MLKWFVIMVENLKEKIEELLNRSRFTADRL